MAWPGLVPELTEVELLLFTTTEGDEPLVDEFARCGKLNRAGSCEFLCEVDDDDVLEPIGVSADGETSSIGTCWHQLKLSLTFPDRVVAGGSGDIFTRLRLAAARPSLLAAVYDDIRD